MSKIVVISTPDGVDAMLIQTKVQLGTEPVIKPRIQITDPMLDVVPFNHLDLRYASVELLKKQPPKRSCSSRTFRYGYLVTT